jgi:transcriptional regulator with XRE-family HTH domain
VKSDLERGAFGAWAFHSRDQLDVSVEEVAERLGYHPASLRKVESGSAEPSRRIVRELPALYRTIAVEKGVALSPAPAEEAPTQATDAGLLAVLSEIRDELRLSRLVSERSAEVLAELLGTLAAGRLPLSETPSADDARAESGVR